VVDKDPRDRKPRAEYSRHVLNGGSEDFKIVCERDRIDDYEGMLYSGMEIQIGRQAEKIGKENNI
jgi:hypothetical protein